MTATHFHHKPHFPLLLCPPLFSTQIHAYFFHFFCVIGICICVLYIHTYIHTVYDPINVAHMFTDIEFTTWALDLATYQGPFPERKLTLSLLAIS